jgi:hypothetical protein
MFRRASGKGQREVFCCKQKLGTRNVEETRQQTKKYEKEQQNQA